MNALPPSIKGWCPSALHPMESGDGLLVRQHFSGGIVSAEQCRAIAGLARAYGNGLIDLTQRGNLQLRGITQQTLSPLTEALRGLGLLDDQAVRHVIGSPLAGLDSTACVDGEKLLRDLETRLVSDVDLQALPDKFCFLVDEGGRLGLDTVSADIRLIGVGGRVVLAIPNGKDGFSPVTAVETADATGAAGALAQAFLKLCQSASARRMDQLVQALGVAAIARAAGFDSPPPAIAARITGAQDVIGLHEGFIGVAAAFGRLNAEQMEALALLAPQTLRLTPWRCILLPGAKTDALATLSDIGLILSPDDARLAIVACPGQPACASAHIDTRQAAEALAPAARARAPRGVSLHISGCSKGCAHAASAPITLTGRDGAFDLILNGRADAEPARQGLDLTQVLALVQVALVQVPALVNEAAADRLRA